METEALERRKVLESDLRLWSDKNNISVDQLRRVYKFLAGVKKELEEHPVASISSLTDKYKISNNYTAVLMDSGLIRYNKPGKVQGYKEWIGDEPTVKMAAEFIGTKTRFEKGTDEPKKRPYGKKRSTFGIDDDLKEKVMSLPDKYPDYVKLSYLFLHYVRDEIAKDNRVSLTHTYKYFNLFQTHVTMLKKLGYVRTDRFFKGVEHTWTAGKPTFTMAEKLDSLAVKQKKLQTQKAYLKRMGKEQEIQEDQTETVDQAMVTHVVPQETKTVPPEPEVISEPKQEEKADFQKTVEEIDQQPKKEKGKKKKKSKESKYIKLENRMKEKQYRLFGFKIFSTVTITINKQA